MFSAEKYSQKYAITITLKPLVRKLSAQDQFERYAYRVVDDVRSAFSKCRLQLVSELTKSYDIHFHGVIQFDLKGLKPSLNLPRWFRDKFRASKYIGFVLCKVIDNTEIWKDYISKQLTAFREDIGMCPVIADDYEELPHNTLRF